MTLETLEKRVEQVEDLIADIPVLINARLETISAGYAETGARLAVIDKQLATLTRDVRDMRGAVTRQLLGQDERIRAVEKHLDRHDARFLVIEEKLDAMDHKFSAMSDQIATILDRLPPRA